MKNGNGLPFNAMFAVIAISILPSITSCATITTNIGQVITANNCATLTTISTIKACHAKKPSLMYILEDIAVDNDIQDIINYQLVVSYTALSTNATTIDKLLLNQKVSDDNVGLFIEQAIKYINDNDYLAIDYLRPVAEYYNTHPTDDGALVVIMAISGAYKDKLERAYPDTILNEADILTPTYRILIEAGHVATVVSLLDLTNNDNKATRHIYDLAKQGHIPAMRALVKKYDRLPTELQQQYRNSYQIIKSKVDMLPKMPSLNWH